jgi:hypothetical protein
MILFGATGVVSHSAGGNAPGSNTIPVISAESAVQSGAQLKRTKFEA